MPSNPGWPCSASSPECLDYRCAPSCLVDRTHSEGVREVVAKISPGPSMDPVLLWGKARRRWSSDSVAGRGPGASWSAATFSHFLLYDSPRMDSLPGAGRVKGSLSFCPESAPCFRGAHTTSYSAQKHWRVESSTQPSSHSEQLKAKVRLKVTGTLIEACSRSASRNLS